MCFWTFTWRNLFKAFEKDVFFFNFKMFSLFNLYYFYEWIPMLWPPLTLCKICFSSSLKFVLKIFSVDIFKNWLEHSEYMYWEALKQSVCLPLIRGQWYEHFNWKLMWSCKHTFLLVFECIIFFPNILTNSWGKSNCSFSAIRQRSYPSLAFSMQCLNTSLLSFTRTPLQGRGPLK